jgi:hypothetical protein
VVVSLPEPTPQEVARFMALVDVLPCGCWDWTGARSRGRGNRKWYGTFYYRGRRIRAHRFSCDVLGKKTVPKGWHRDHTCHFSMCVNFDHLEPVPPATNQARKEARRFTSSRDQRTIASSAVVEDSDA